MSRPLLRLLAVVLALATAGAQVVCACPMLGEVKATPPVVQKCAGEAECCRKDVAETQAPVQKEEPCDKCNLKHRALQAMPDAQGSAPAIQSAPAAFGVLVVAALMVEPMAQYQCYLDGGPPPLLLRDLVSSHALLLN